MTDQGKENSTPTVSEQEKQLASKALQEFRNSHFEECIQLLKKLSDARSNDGRVLVNRAVADFYQSNCCKTDELRKQLAAAKKQLGKSSVNSNDELGNIGRCFMMYNEGILHYNLKQPKAAVNIFEQLFKVIEPLDDCLAIKVCFFLVELYLSTYKLDQAHGMLKFIEDVIFAPKTFTPLHTSSNDGKNGENGKNKSLEHAPNSKEIPEEHRLNLFMLKARLPLLQKSLKECKRELKSLLNISGNNPDALFLKSNYEYVRGNYPKAVKLLNSTPLGSTSVMERGQSLTTLFYNNMGCIHFKMKKYNLAVFYARKALDENINAMKSLPPIEKNHQLSGRPLHTLAINKRSEILYNMGVQLLFAGKPVPAFDCLMESPDLYECHPRYWLRLTEACIMVHQQFQREIIHNPAKKSSFVRGVVGSGFHRKIILSPIHDHNKIHRHESQSSAMPAPTIEFGNICLSNAMRLLPNAKDIDAAFKQLAALPQEAQQGSEKYMEKSYALGAQLAKDVPGEPMSVQELFLMRLSVIACHAYVSLGLGDYVKSLDYSKELLSQAMLPGAYKYLGRLYMAESLIKLDKIAEAIQELSPDKVTDISTQLDGDSQDKYQNPSAAVFPGSIQEARAIMLFNLASACAIRGEIDKSKRVLQQVVTGKLPESILTHAILLSAYIELKNGNKHIALDIIKRGEVFPSGRLVDRIDAARMSQIQQQQQQYHQHFANIQQQQQQNQLTQQQPIHPPHSRSAFTSSSGPQSGQSVFQQRSPLSEDLLGNLQRPF
eukprot:gene19107-21023_t